MDTCGWGNVHDWTLAQVPVMNLPVNITGDITEVSKNLNILM